MHTYIHTYIHTHTYICRLAAAPDPELEAQTQHWTPGGPAS